MGVVSQGGDTPLSKVKTFWNYFFGANHSPYSLIAFKNYNFALVCSICLGMNQDLLKKCDIYKIPIEAFLHY